jgi:hypothetical protein
MGFFDSIREEQEVQGYVSRIDTGIHQLGKELESSRGTITPNARGLAFAIKREYNSMIPILDRLSDKTKWSMNVQTKQGKKRLMEFLMIFIQIAGEAKRETGLDLM